MRRRSFHFGIAVAAGFDEGFGHSSLLHRPTSSRAVNVNVSCSAGGGGGAAVSAASQSSQTSSLHPDDVDDENDISASFPKVAAFWFVSH